MPLHSQSSRPWRWAKSLLTLNLALVVVFSAGVPLINPTDRAQAVLAATPVHLLSSATNGVSLDKGWGRQIGFEQNHGQTDKAVRFRLRGNGYSLSLKPTEAVLSLSRPVETKRAFGAAQPKAVIRMKLIGANPNPMIEGLDRLPGQINYFTGNDQKKWRTAGAHFQRVKYHQIYPGIDLIYYINNEQVEYDFDVAPGADPKKIRIEFKGAEKLEIDTAGDLVMHTSAGAVRHRKPSTHQFDAGQKRLIENRYVLHGKRQVGFELGDYDPIRPLVIDPVIAYSSLLGGNSGPNDASWANGIATHIASDGNVYVYVLGITGQADFPVRNAAQPSFGGMSDIAWEAEVFVSKFNMAASGDASLVWSTYLGGSGNELGAGIAVDSSGNAYVTGYTNSTDFPIVKASQPSFGGGSFVGDAFVTSLNADGFSFNYSTYLGGSLADAGLGIAVDPTSNAYVTGKTNSADFPVVNPYQPTPQGSNATFVAKIAPPVGAAPASLIYSTYLGGSSRQLSPCLCPFSQTNERGNSIAVDSAGNIYVTGTTGSTNFPIVNGFQSTLQSLNGNVFVTKLNPANSGSASLIYSTYLGGSSGYGGDTGMSIAVDSIGNAYVTGETYSSDFPTTPGAFMGISKTRSTGFVARVDTSKTGSQSLVYSTFLGGTAFNAPEFATGIAVDAAGNAYVTGVTHSYDFPQVDAAQASNRGVFQSIDGGSKWIATSKGIPPVPSVNALAIDASTSPRTLYAGAPAPAGVFKSTDGGMNWSTTNSGLTNTDIKSLLISPTNPSIIYAGTPGGVFRSTDAGGSWNSFSLGLGSAQINDLVADTNTTTGVITFYAGTDSGLFKMVEGANTWSAMSLNQFAMRVVIDPKTSPHAIFVVGHLGGYAASYRSLDGGTTWSELIHPYNGGFGSMAVDTATNPSTVYAIGTDYTYLWKSVDSGSSWEPTTTEGLDFWFQFISEPDMTIDPRTTPSTIYLYDYYVLASRDNGLTLTSLFEANVAAFEVDNVSPSTFYVGTKNGEADAFVTKLNPAGSALLFSTFLGSYGWDSGNGIAVDASQNIYIAGKTQLGPFPAVNAYQATGSRIKSFVVKLGSAALPAISAGSVTTELAVQTGTLELSFPNITGSTSGTAPTATVNPLDSIATANLTLSNNLGAYEIKTTALYDTSGYANDPTKGVKIVFSVPAVSDPTVFNNLVISHGEDSNSDNVIQANEMIPYNGTVDPNKVTVHDFATRTIWVYVPSLSPFVIVKGASEQFGDLVRTIKTFNLKTGIQNGLDAKLQNALKAYQAALAKDRATACNQMTSFTSEVQAQTGKALTQAQANQLIAAARQLRVVLGCR